MWEGLSDCSSGLCVIRQRSSCGNNYPSFTFFQSSDVLFLSSLIQLLNRQEHFIYEWCISFEPLCLLPPCNVSWYGIVIHAVSMICLFCHILCLAYRVHRTICMVIGKSPFTIPTLWFDWINGGCPFLSLCHFQRSLIFSFGVWGSQCSHSDSGRLRIRLEHLFF